MNRALLHAQRSPTAMVKALRLAAETARRDPYWTPDDGEQRAQAYEREAERLERAA